MDTAYANVRTLSKLFRRPLEATGHLPATHANGLFNNLA
jgi:hypothetical protein